MQKSAKYYKDMVKVTYPDMTKLTIKEFDAISNEIISNISDKDKCKKILPRLYSRMLSQFNHLAVEYAKTNLSDDLFEDAMSSLYLLYMESFNAKIDRGQWYANYSLFTATGYRILDRLMFNLQLSDSDAPVVSDSNNLYNFSGANIIGKSKSNSNLVQLTRLSLFDDVLEDIVDEKTLDDITALTEHNSMTEIIDKRLFKYLTPDQYTVICKFFGLKGNQNMNMANIAKNYGVTRDQVRILLTHAMQRLRNYREVKYIKDFIQ